MLKNTSFNYKMKTEIKATTTTIIKNELKYFPMSEGNMTFYEVSLLYYHITTNSAVNRNIKRAINN